MITPPLKIEFKGNKPNVAKLTAVFPSQPFPDMVKIKNTDDTNKVNKNTGKWDSKGKYPSPGVTIEVFLADSPVGEFTYDATGNRVTSPTGRVFLILFDVYYVENKVFIDFISEIEENVAAYYLEKRSGETPTPVGNPIPPKGVNQTYSVIDTPSTGDYVYYLRVQYNGSAEKVELASAPISI